ncbi:class I SAM-dependent methyltransferase [Desulfolithobacter sp.]
MPGSSPCPLCGALDRTEAGTQVLPVMDDRHPARVLQHLTATYLVCDHCGTVSQYPLPTVAALNRYYANTPPPRTVADTTVYKTPVLEDRLDLLQKITGLTSGRCLEVGCADGALLDLVAGRWGLETVGLEPAPSANDEYSSHRIIHGTLADLVASEELEPASCDLVICRHVLEHVHDPALFLDQLAGFVTDRGWLLLEVPSSLLLASDGDYHIGQNIHTTHLHHFTGPGLTSAITERGLAVVHLSDRDVGRYPCLCLVATGGLGAGKLFARQLACQQRSSRRAAAELAALLENDAPAADGVLVWGAGVDLLGVLQYLPVELQARLYVYDANPAKQNHKLLAASILDDHALENLAPWLILASVSNRTLLEDIRDAAAARFPGVPFRCLFRLKETPCMLDP